MMQVHDYRSTPKLERVYSPSQLHAARPNYQASIPASTWKIIRELGIRRKPATHRGCRAGRRKLKHFRNNIPTIITSSRSEGVKQHRNVVSVNHNNLVKIRTVDPIEIHQRYMTCLLLCCVMPGQRTINSMSYQLSFLSMM